MGRREGGEGGVGGELWLVCGEEREVRPLLSEGRVAAK